MSKITDYVNYVYDGFWVRHQIKRVDRMIEVSELEEEYQRAVGEWDEKSLVEKFMYYWNRYNK